jgi:hypothetical protein
MSAASRRPAREQRTARRKAQRQLRKRQRAAGISTASHPSRPNRNSPYQTIEQEEQARIEAVVEHARLIRRQLATLLAELSQIPDPRKPFLLTHKLTTLMVYGILMFVLHSGSRRKTNEKFTAPAMKDALMQLFPDLESVPHHQTLFRLLSDIDPERIETAQMALVASLMREKKFRDHLVEGRYLIAIDGTQKLVRRQLPADRWLQRKVGAEGKKRTQYYVYVLEANLVLSNGVTIPLMSEFLDYHQGDSEREKQDCEQRGFFRLAERLKKAFPHLPIMVLLDGLFPTGPVISRCRHYRWRFMIVLKDGSLPYVWQEYQGLRRLLGEQERLSQRWGERDQQFELVNEIDYHYGDKQKRRLTVHLAVCRESWPAVQEQNKVVQCSRKWAWLSDAPFRRETTHLRCNLAGRHRWAIEEGILVEKCQGYQYEHCYAENWNAMRGYHYLMRIAHLLNVLASLSSSLAAGFKERGAQGFIEWIRTTLSGRWLHPQPAGLQARLNAPFQLRLVLPVPEPPVPLAA